MRKSKNLTRAQHDPQHHDDVSPTDTVVDLATVLLSERHVHDRHDVLCEADAARYISLSKAWLRKQRRLGNAPSYLRLGRRVRYLRADLDSLLKSARVAPGGLR